MRKAFRTALVAAFWLTVWAVCARLIGKPLLLPGPLETATVLLRLVGTASFWEDTLTTMGRILLGYTLAILAGSLLGMVCGFYPPADALLSPVRQIIRATPVSSFIILVLLWLRTGIVPVFISFLMVLPIVWTGVQEGLSNTDQDLLEMARAYRFSRMKLLRYVYYPSVRPFFSAACVTGLGFAWKSGIAAEVIARPARAVGANLQDAKVYLETPELFAWTLVIVLISVGFEKLFMAALGALERRLTRL